MSKCQRRGKMPGSLCRLDRPHCWPSSARQRCCFSAIAAQAQMQKMRVGFPCTFPRLGWRLLHFAIELIFGVIYSFSDQSMQTLVVSVSC